VAEFSSSPEGKVLARLAQLHRTEQVPPAARARFAEQLVRLEAAPPAAQTPRGSRTGSGWSPRWMVTSALAAVGLAAAALLCVVARPEHVVPLREPGTATPLSVTCSAARGGVAGSLRWRASGAEHDVDGRTCLYRFSLQPEGVAAPIEVHWTQCAFPEQLREQTGRRRSPMTGELHVFVAGSWSEPGRLQATELRVLP
jgi:hypothetical protein